MTAGPGRRTTPITVLTPIMAGKTNELRSRLTALPVGVVSPFERLPSTHFARFVLIHDLPEDFAGAPWPRSAPLKMSYLLFTSTFNGTVEHYVEELRVTLGIEADALWGLCVNYPGSHRAVEFRRYLLHNQLTVRNMWRAYDETAPDVCRSLKLRAAHRELAVSVQGLTADEVLATFREKFLSNP